MAERFGPTAGREIAFFTTARNGISYDIDIVDPDSGALPHLAVTGDGCSLVSARLVGG